MQLPKLSAYKRQIQTVGGLAAAAAVLTLLLLTYPWLQLQAANQLIDGEKYAQAEKILLRLSTRKPEWTEPRYKLAVCQLRQSKGREAAATVISLADTSTLADMDLAMIFLQVAEQLINTGYSAEALGLAQKVLLERPDDKLLAQAVVEIGFLIAERSGLPLSLEALDTALPLAGDNWLLTRKAFNILLAKAFGAPPDLAEAALDAALELYPDNVLAITGKAKLLGQRSHPRQALDYLAEKEQNVLDNVTEDYLDVKRTLISQLASIDPEADLRKYIQGFSESTVQEIALQGLDKAWRQNLSGKQFYQLAEHVPQVVYRYARNLIDLKQWQDARTAFKNLQKLDPKYANFDALFAFLDSKLTTAIETLRYSGFFPDMAAISPRGNALAMRVWMDLSHSEDMMVSDLLVVNLANGQRESLGNAHIFKWDPGGNYLAFLTASPAGSGRLHIYAVASGQRFSSPPDYDVFDFNWAGTTLMVQVQRGNAISLLQMSPPNWTISGELDWTLSGAVNGDLAWLTASKNTLVVHKYQQQPQRIALPKEIAAINPWSPNGRLAIIEDIASKSWIYDYRRNEVTAIELPGNFAAWGREQDIFWYYPVWDKWYVLARLDASGKVVEYLPYSFSYPSYDLTISANRNIVAVVEGDQVFIQRR